MMVEKHQTDHFNLTHLVNKNEKLPLSVVFYLLSASEYAGKTFDPLTISNQRVACVTCVKYERLEITVSNVGGSC